VPHAEEIAAHDLPDLFVGVAFDSPSTIAEVGLLTEGGKYSYRADRSDRDVVHADEPFHMIDVRTIPQASRTRPLANPIRPPFPQSHGSRHLSGSGPGVQRLAPV
jgi:hypothetical protein